MAAVAVESVDAIEQFSGILSGALERLLDLHAAAHAEWVRASDEATERLEQARVRLRECEENLSSAESALASCESQQTEDHDPDCSSEEQDVEDGRRAVFNAEATVEEAILQQGRIFAVGEVLDRQAALVEAWISSAGPRTQGALVRAVEQLREYLAVAPPSSSALGVIAAKGLSSVATTVPTWFLWAPGKNDAVITPSQVLNRFRVAEPELREITRHLCQFDERFREEIERRRRDYGMATGKADQDAVFVQTTKQCSGLWAEKFVEYALAPLAGRVRVQRYVADFSEAGRRGTVTDLVLEELRWPVVFGRGKGAGVQAGANLSIEVKTGRKDYLFSQLQHMQTQVSGHRGESASMCLLSKDLKDLSREKQRELRNSLHGSGSRVFAFLPRKEMIDQLCWEQVCAAHETL